MFLVVLLGILGWIAKGQLAYSDAGTTLLISGVFIVGTVLYSIGRPRGLAMAGDQESFEASGFGVNAKLTGRRLVSDNLLLIILFAVLLFMEYSNQVLILKLTDTVAENSYILSLSQAERESLRIQMPDSLRRKLRER